MFRLKALDCDMGEVHSIVTSSKQSKIELKKIMILLSHVTTLTNKISCKQPQAVSSEQFS